MYVVPWRHKCLYSYDNQSKKMDSYDIAKRTYDFVMTCVGNRTLCYAVPRRYLKNYICNCNMQVFISQPFLLTLRKCE